MKTIIGRSDVRTAGSVCAIGGFDGVHRGHQAVIGFMKKKAASGKRIGIITMLPLPIFVLNPIPEFYLTPKKEKEAIFDGLGIDFVYYFRFTKKFAGLTPHRFVGLIKEQIQPSMIVVGENFHFGKDRAGDVTMLREIAGGDPVVEIMPSVKDEGTISSTRIRELLLLGHVRAADRLLGRSYQIQGQVVRGKGKGQRLGFPTINLAVPKDKLLPMDGVYKVTVDFDDHEYLGAMFSRHDLVEIHLVGFTGDLYRHTVLVKVLDRIRDVRSFSDDESLRAAIAKDVNVVKEH